jgi:aspartyl/asparaginyl-tRNA synthetase
MLNLDTPAGTPSPSPFDNGANRQSAMFQFPGRPLPLARRLAVHNRVLGSIRQFMTERRFNEVPVPAVSAATGSWEATSRFYLDSMIARNFPAVWCESDAVPQPGEPLDKRLAGFKRIEAEQVGLNLEQLCDLMEDLFRQVAAGLGADLLGGRQTTRLDRTATLEHGRLTYREALRILNNRGWSLEFGEALPAEAQASLCRFCNNMPVMVTNLPAALRFFTTRIDENDPLTSLSVDYILPYAGTCFDGAVRETDPSRMKARIDEHPRPNSSFDSYLNLFAARPLDRAGFGLGAAQLLQHLMGVQNIQDAVIHPLVTSGLMATKSAEESSSPAQSQARTGEV